MLESIIPPHRKGMKTGAVVHRRMATRQQAQHLFDIAARRLLSVNQWQHYAGPLSASFLHTDDEGHPVLGRLPEAGDRIRIKLPGPPNPEGNGFDWVAIKEINTEVNSDGRYESIAMSVRPAPDPRTLTGEEETAHFYTPEASSVFAIVRRDKSLWAMELGRNEHPNLTGGVLTRLRNLLVAVMAWLGIAKSQWKALVKGWIAD